MTRPTPSSADPDRGRPARAARRRAIVGGLGAIGLGGAALLLLAPGASAGPEGDNGAPAPIATTGADFFQSGTQPQDGSPDFQPIVNVNQCTICHANYDPVVEPVNLWAASMLGQSARDPVFWAAVSIANQDAHEAGQFCIRCHAPVAFVSGHHESGTDVEFTNKDFQGISCSICHRVVNPVFDEGTSPPQDAPIIDELLLAGLLPPQMSNARYVLDVEDNRRGPRDDLPIEPHQVPFGIETIHSEFHATSELCWTCHDVSNPLMVGSFADGYDLGALDAPHPTDDQADQFPLHRTYSEWKNSYYSTVGVQHDGRFGGNHPTGVMHTCQDCHMPDTEGQGCNLGEPFFPRPDVAQHSFMGANTWVLRAVRSLHDDSQTLLTEASVNEAIARNEAMLQAASDLEAEQNGSLLRARLVNRSGHKLPTGFPDGRRIWLNVRFLDAQGELVDEYGAYDHDTATLIDGGSDTKVYEAKFGISQDLAKDLGRPAGHTFNFVLANELLKDNRIPPAGWNAAQAEADSMAPVGATYANGQHWDDTDFAIPPGATTAVVSANYQLTSREFIEFLRDENVTDDRGQTAYDQWALHGKSQPVVMDMLQLDLLPLGDIDGDGVVGFDDLVLLLSVWGDCPAPPLPCPADLDGDGAAGFGDLIILLGAWTA